MIRDQGNDNNHHLPMTFELSSKKWKILFSDHAKRRLICIEAGDLKHLEIEVSKAQKMSGLSQDCLHYSCYEAGRDGFWIHRYLQSRQTESFIVDASSIKDLGKKMNKMAPDLVPSSRRASGSIWEYAAACLTPKTGQKTNQNVKPKRKTKA